MDRHVWARSNPEQRWLLLSHVLFSAALGVPTIMVAVSRTPGLLVTLAIAAGFAVWYVALFGARPERQEQGGRMVIYAVGALTFFTALNVRDDAYFLLLYCLLPQFFAALPRGLAVLGVAGIVVLPPVVTGGLGELLSDTTALFSLLASVGLGLAITAVIDALSKQTEQRERTIAELEQARAENEQLLARAQRDVRERDALARAGHALIAARSPADVSAALSEQLAEHSADVRGVALLSSRNADQAEVLAAVSGTASPAVGSTVPLPRRPADGAVVVLTRDELSSDERIRLAGVQAVALLSLHTAADASATATNGAAAAHMTPDADLLWLGLGTAQQDEAMLRDLSTVATETALALANLRLASQAAAQGRTAGMFAERQRLAHEIHDTLAQGLTSIVTQLEAAEQALERDRALSAAHLDQAKRTARDSLREARRTVEALRPQPLERVGLPDALRDVAARWRNAQSPPTDVAVVIDGDPARLAPAVDAALLRIAQEALANIGKHAHARHVDLTLSYLNDLVLLDVQDDGIGFDAANPAPATGDLAHGGYGLTAMRERMTLVGGQLVVESAPGDGTTVAASVPLTNVNGDRPASSDGQKSR